MTPHASLTGFPFYEFLNIGKGLVLDLMLYQPL
jgi:hypothetical protein